MIRYSCRDCDAPIDRNPPKKKAQPATGYCDCNDSVWLLVSEVSPVKLQKRADKDPPFEALRDRVVVIPTRTMPPRTSR